MKHKIDKIDILAMIACVIIATVSVVCSLYSDRYTCSWCEKRIHKTEDEYVVCYGCVYYHPECYLEKLKEERKHETD